MTEKLDTDSLNASIDLVELVGRYAPLQKDGKDYKGLCIFHNEKTPSMTVSPEKGFVHCFGCGAHHDAIGFFMAVENLDFKAATAKLLNGSGTGTGYVIPQRTTKLKKAPPRKTFAPPADNAKPAMTIKTLGEPVAVWTYRTPEGDPLGYVARYQDGDKKTIRCWTWGSRSKNDPPAWTCGAFSEPRPLYGLDRLAARPEAQVLIVEGEKTTDAATRLFPALVAVTWPGGAEALEKTDWSALKGRKCVLLPDNDAPGIDAMHRLARLLHKAGAVEIKGITPGTTIYGDDAGKGWDLADEPADTPPEMALSWARPLIFQYINGELPTNPASGSPHEPPAPQLPTVAGPLPPPTTLQNASPETDAPPDAEALAIAPTPQESTPSPIPDTYQALATNEKGALLMNLDNAVRAIESEGILKNHIWYDEFLDAIVTDWNGPERQWKDADDKLLCLFLQRHVGLTRISVNQAHDAAEIAAFHDTRNECRDWLDSLTWDNTPRLPHMLADGFGAELDTYSQAVGRCWMVSIVARVMRPGCKVDTVPVLEGGQGIGKSSGLAIIGGKWFVECHENVMTKDFYGVLNGHMLVEISEMHSFSRAEVERIKGIISCQVDRYRKAYGRNTEDHPRHTVLVCTTNRDDWQKDETGARRFWPVKCGDINLDYLTANRDQLFAEAVHRYRAGEQWWDVPVDEQREQTDMRRDVDAWELAIESWLQGRDTVQISHLLEDCLNIELSKQDILIQRRAGRILRALGWQNKVRRGPDMKNRKVWVRGDYDVTPRPDAPPVTD